MIQQVQGDMICEWKRKKQLATIFHLLQMGKPMVEYQTPMKPLFDFLKIPMKSHKHWLDVYWFHVQGNVRKGKASNL